MLTAGFWGIALLMMANGSDSKWNPAWRMVSSLRNGFTWAGVVVVGFIALVVIGTGLGAVYEEHQKEKLRKQEAAIEAQKRELQRLEYLEKERLESLKIAEARQEKQKEEEERLLRKKLEKQRRSAADANKAALNDF